MPNIVFSAIQALAQGKRKFCRPMLRWLDKNVMGIGVSSLNRIIFLHVVQLALHCPIFSGQVVIQAKHEILVLDEFQ